MSDDDHRNRCIECGHAEVVDGEFDECLACGEPMCDECKLDHEDTCE
jgi:hypothetical protein